MISAIQLIVARPLAGSGGEIGYSTTRCRNEPTPTNEAPLRIGTPGVVPRHMIAPPHWIGGCVGMHLRAHRRMQAVRGDQQAGRRIRGGGRRAIRSAR